MQSNKYPKTANNGIIILRMVMYEVWHLRIPNYSLFDIRTPNSMKAEDNRGNGDKVVDLRIEKEGRN